MSQINNQDPFLKYNQFFLSNVIEKVRDLKMCLIILLFCQKCLRFHDFHL